MESPLGNAHAVIHIGQRLALKGFIAGADGNISVRLSPDEIMVTPSGLPKGGLSPDDLVVVDPTGNHLRGSRRASSELLMHLYVYQQRPEVMACVHSHPPTTTAFAVAGRELPPDILPEVVLVVGAIPLTVYAATGTDEVPRALAPYIHRDNAFMLRNHGLLTIGQSLEEAWARHETVEHYARIIHLASQLGQINPLPEAEVRRLEGMREKLLQSMREQVKG
jgi:L-fuculose-phosphate aldolase